ncbi:MAG: hypothetical protein CMK89_14640 [Pseudomonadales bacterium]|nr:hypothetical protein [Pseudomonadales bacterium]
MTKPYLTKSNQLCAVLIGVMLSLSSATAFAETSQWTPMSSEKLIQMPAGYLDRYVEQDFRQSPLGKNLQEVDGALSGQRSGMASLRDSIKRTEGEQNKLLRYQLLQAKSDYLDGVEEKQRLERMALDKKSKVYQDVLASILKDQRARKDPVTMRLVEQQQAARDRMERSIALVDDVLANQSDSKPTRYSKQYKENLDKVEALKTAIASHVANASPVVEGRDVSREEYVRFLLANVESERALLDQEQLMLGYMARLVALDAHTLEQEVALGLDDDTGGEANAEPERLAEAADLFIE